MNAVMLRAGRERGRGDSRSRSDLCGASWSHSRKGKDFVCSVAMSRAGVRTKSWFWSRGGRIFSSWGHSREDVTTRSVCRSEGGPR